MPKKDVIYRKTEYVRCIEYRDQLLAQRIEKLIPLDETVDTEYHMQVTFSTNRGPISYMHNMGDDITDIDDAFEKYGEHAVIAQQDFTRKQATPSIVLPK